MTDLELTSKHKSIGAKIVDYAGFNMPVQYEGVIIEHLSVRNNAGVFDVSHMGEIFVNGDEADNFLQFITSNDISKLYPGKVQYSCLPNNNGGIVDDILVYKISDSSFMLVVNASNIEKDFNWLNENNTFNCEIINHSSKYSLLALQGPNSLKILNEVFNVNLSSLEYYCFLKCDLLEIKDVIVSRTGYTGELGYELYIQNKDALKLWDYLFSSKHEVKPIGLAARNTLRLEKGFCLYGNDIDDTTSPLEAGLGWITKFSTKFINSDFFIEQNKIGLDKKLVGFEVIGKGIARQHYQVFNYKNENIGVVTSGSMSPSLNKAIGMAYVIINETQVENKILIKVRNKYIDAKIVNLPFL